jgi:sugar phosphate isomerase/epimerase
MKISGHTLGTPGMTLAEAFSLFKMVGLDAAEIIWQDDYTAAIPESASEEQILEIKHQAQDQGLGIACLTPYMAAINSLNEIEREVDIHRFKACIHAAELLECPTIRVYAGKFIPGDEDKEAKYARLIQSLQELGPLANKAGITLCVENHFSTMTVSAKETADLVRKVNSPGVGILYDQANLTFTLNEEYAEAIDLQKGMIQHAHVKDLEFKDSYKTFQASAVAQVSQEERKIRSRVVGEGVLDWPNILSYLILQTGYQGFISLEYEYRWHAADLPSPEIGFKIGATTVRKILSSIEKV